MAANNYYCQHCDLAFEPEAETLQARCPTCMRTSGVTRQAQPTQGTSKVRVLVGSALLASVVGSLIWFVLASNNTGESDDAQQSSAPGTTVVETAAHAKSEREDSETDDSSGVSAAAPEPVSVDPVFNKLANHLVNNPMPASLTKKLNQQIVVQPSDAPLGRDILSAQERAKLMLESDAKVTMTSIEVAALTLNLMRAIGQSAQAVIVSSDHSGLTSLLNRTLAVKLLDKENIIAPDLSPTPINKKTVVITDDHLDAHLTALMAIRLLEQHQFEAGSKKLSEITGQSDAAFDFLRGQVASLRGEVDAGLEQMAAAVSKSEDAAGRFQLGVGFLRAEQTFKAFSAFKRAVALDPLHTQSWHALGQLALERRASAPEVQHAAIDTELDEVEKALEKVGSDTPELLQLKVQRLLVIGKVNEAKQLALDTVKSQPKNSQIHMILAELWRAQGNNQEALNHLKLASSVDSTSPEAVLMMARLYGEMGNNDEALKALELAVKRAPFDAELLVQLVNAYDASNRSEDAERVAKSLVKKFPDLPQGSILMAQVALNAKRYKDAINILEEASKQRPRNTEILMMLYFTYATNSQSKEANSTLQRLLTFDPDGRLKIAQQMLQTGQMEASATLLAEEFEAKPHRLEVAITLAQFMRVGKNQKEVERIRKKALEHAPDKGKFEAMFDQAIDEIDKQAAADFQRNAGDNAAVPTDTAPQKQPQKSESTSTK